MGSTGIVHAPPPKSISSQRRAIGRSTPTGGISTSGSAFTNEVTETWHAETLFEETLLPVCSPAFLEARGRPREPADLHGWPLLYDLHWTTDWSHWFAHHGARAADLSPASGFRLYSMMVQAAVKGMGVALGHSLMITRELEQGTLVSLFDSRVTAPARYLLVTAPASMGKPRGAGVPAVDPRPGRASISWWRAARAGRDRLLPVADDGHVLYRGGGVCCLSRGRGRWKRDEEVHRCCNAAP